MSTAGQQEWAEPSAAADRRGVERFWTSWLTESRWPLSGVVQPPEGFGMRLPLPGELLETLRDLHRRQHAEMSPDWLTRVEELFPEGAVFLWTSLGHASYLTLGGQVVFTTPDDQPPRALDSLRAVASILVRGARELGLPELISALPVRPAGQPVCPGCGGRRWDDTPHPGHPEGTVCMYCSGLGWLPPGQAAPGAAPDTRCM